MCNRPCFWQLELLTKFSKREGLTELQLLEGVAGNEGRGGGGGYFFQGGCNFHIKDKLKSEIFNDKKRFISKTIFVCHN